MVIEEYKLADQTERLVLSYKTQFEEQFEILKNLKEI
jgi:hypothetical protein